eukprot:Gb_09741 [translate_table: standard]
MYIVSSSSISSVVSDSMASALQSPPSISQTINISGILQSPRVQFSNHQFLWNDSFLRSQLRKKKMNFGVEMMYQKTVKCTKLVQNPKDEHRAKVGYCDVSWDVKKLCQGGRLKDAVDNLDAMDQLCIQVNSQTYASLLQACIDMKSVEEGRRVQTHMIKTEFEPDNFLKTKLVILYMKCGSLLDARRLFDEMPERDVMLWNAIITAYAKHRQDLEALAFFYQMLREGIEPDQFTFSSIVTACARLSAMERGKQVHACIIKTSLQSHVFVGSALVDMYAKFGSIEDAFAVFDGIFERNVVSWNAIIGGCMQCGNGEEALKLFCEMQQAGMTPDQFTFASVLRVCARQLALREGKRIHSRTIKSGFERDVVLSAALLDMYAKCKSVEDARQVFDEMYEKDLVSWNAMIAGYTQNGHWKAALVLFYQLQQGGIEADQFTFASILTACANLVALEEGKQLHAYTIRKGCESDVVLESALIDMYAKCGSIRNARHVFNNMSQRNVVAWNAMITGYTENGDGEKALTIFHQMQQLGMKPDQFTFAVLLSLCAVLRSLEWGKEVHAHIVRSEFQSHIILETTLVGMYAKCGSLKDARQILDKMIEKNAFSWNTMIVGYTQNGYGAEALTLFHQMQLVGIKPDHFAIASVLNACAGLVALEQGKQVHALVIKGGFESHVVLGSSLVDMYAKCGNIENARHVFDKMFVKHIALWNIMIRGYGTSNECRRVEDAHHVFDTVSGNVISWNAMISAYAQHGYGEEALELLNQMQKAGMTPNQFTFASILKVSANVAALELGRQVHAYIVRYGFVLDVVLGSALVDMYAKCGSIESACLVFTKMPERNVITWNTMIAGYGKHGYGKEAIQLFEQMQQSNMKPNHITFLSIISACSHAGLVDEGWHYFDSMTQNYCILPTAEHYACVVDLLGRAGRMDEVHDFINKMSFEPNAALWGALLGACRIHMDIELGRLAAERLFELDPKNPGNYVVLSNIYAVAGRWEDVAKVRKMMKDRGVKKEPGCSWIEVNKQVHTFLVGDRSHSQTEEIYATLKRLDWQMKEMGYVPDTNFVLHNVKEEQKEHMLCHHSEKLAIVFGLINTPPGAPIRVNKNIRVCGNCHTAIKFISIIIKREIVVRDVNRFHHFKEGLCSCGDYW